MGAAGVARGAADGAIDRHIIWLFAGSDAGGERAAAISSLLGTAKLNGLNVEAHLGHVLERLPEHPINRLDELIPWAVATELPAQRVAA